MAMVICCPCGTPIDFEHLELVVTLTCPQCKRELDLELDNGPVDRRRAVLTVMAGPHWVGERFVLPVGVDLNIGQAGGNWIALDDEMVSEIHCRLRLMQDGAVVVEDRQSKTGTWIGNQRIARGKLGPKQSLRIGQFRLRLDYQAIDGSTILTAPPSSAVSDSSGMLPTMTKVRAKATPTNWLITNRFRLVRVMILFAAWAMGLYHAVALHASNATNWRWPIAITGGIVIAGLLTAFGRRVSMSDKHLKFAPLVLFLILAVADLILAMPASAVASLGLAACLSLLILQTPAPAAAVAGVLTGGFASIVLVVATIRNLLALIA